MDQLQYLDRYKSLENPDFAVLVKGAWGVGKTYQVKAKFSDEKYYYVSLFGLKHSDQVYATLLSEVSQTLDKLATGFKFLSDIKLSLFGDKINLPPSLADYAIKKVLFTKMERSKVIIFDDLERSGIPFAELWGLINQFVEHEKRKVVLICHDEKLHECFSAQKEKIIGQEILALPCTKEAFSVFLDDLVFLDEFEEQGKDKLSDLKSLILEVFDESQVHSLRVLRRALYDLNRLFKCFPERYFKNRPALEKLSRFFLIFAFAYRSGKLTEHDIKTRHEQYTKHYTSQNSNTQAVENSSPIVELQERHSNIDLSWDILRNEDLLNILVCGKYEKDVLIEWLDQTFFPPSFDDFPAWRRLLDFDRLEDDEVKSTILELDDQFTNRSLTHQGEFLHMFALRLLMIEHKERTGNFKNEVKACKKYIDDVADAGQLSAEQSDDYHFDDFSQSYGGMGFFITDATREHMNEIYKHLQLKEKEVFENTLSDKFNHALEIMQSDGRNFLQLISSYGDGKHEYAMHPIFKYASPDYVADLWMQAPVSEWADISRAFKNRYSSSLQNELKEEREFVKGLVDSLNRRADKTGGLKGYRIRRHINDIKEIVQDMNS